MRNFILFLLTLMLMACPALAAEEEVVYCFSAADFSAADSMPLGGCITEVPEADCTIRSGSRSIRPGDVLTIAQLSTLEAASMSETGSTVRISWLPIHEDGVRQEQTLYLALRGTKNQPPVAENSEIETYKNLKISGTLRCTDPEGDPLVCVLIKEPKRGEVIIHEDGTFTYTPKDEKVGKDMFSFIAEDTAGNRSEEARVTVQIRKTTSSGVFADMTGDPNEFEALFLRSSGLFSGEYVGGTLCFCPEKPVSSEEFLMMSMKLTGLMPEAEATGGSWFAPWQTAALRAGLTVRSAEELTTPDAAVLVAGLLDLPADEAVTVFADGEDRVTAACMNALSGAGLQSFSDASGVITRRDAAVMLYEIHRWCKEHEVRFPWDS